ncbi:Gfo/Idh/MocA family protein [Stieleria marina]|uniref:Inositol 2-dehydrogenase n=1 Tax=Stieleria marina TaxID=1930275 RepID=A0A517NLU3_9BACT|nr:Inositol 2-dehydrogenase [Planctomycetes bacterium K23_9]
MSQILVVIVTWKENMTDLKSMNRRRMLRTTLAWGGAAVFASRTDRAQGFMAANDRPQVAAVGTGSRWCQKATGIDRPYGSAPDMRKYGDYVVVCDADENRRSLASMLTKGWTGTAADSVADYRAILDRDDIDIVHISTPDHWHAKIAIEAMLAGKDVYCEKPMTLTIDEGKKMVDVCRQTERIVQIGTQQRSNPKFIQALALIPDGRIGTLQKATCSVGGAPTSPMLPKADVPQGLDWDKWQGPVPGSDFRSLAGNKNETSSWSRGHYEFRWWYEYSGGKLTDWGAHHVDIATWGLGNTKMGPISVNPISVKHPVSFKDGYPTDNTQYNTATEFQIQATFDDGIELEIRHDGDNGILFEGSDGRIFVNRGRLTGKAVEDLKSNPLPDRALEKVYKNRPLVDHFRNFFEAATDRKEPISDVFSHHRALSTCHLAGIAARLGREIKWDPKKEQVVGDDQAQSFIARDYRDGFEIET